MFIHASCWFSEFVCDNIGFKEMKNTIVFYFMTPWKWKSVSHVPLFATPWTIQSMEFFRPEYWEWVAFPFSRGSSQPRDQTQVSCIAGGSLPAEPQGSPKIRNWVAYPFSSGSSQPGNRTGVSCITRGFFTNWAIREAPVTPRCLKSQLYLSVHTLQ